MKRHLLFALSTIVLASGAGACSSDGPGYQSGALGNGGFYFACDDAVTCTPYSNDASKFPKVVSLGASFNVRFVPKSGLDLTNNNTSGITLSSVGDYLSGSPAGELVAVKAGYGTIAARDSGGQLVDYVVMTVERPDALVVYDGDDPTATTRPAPLGSVTLANGATKRLRAFAQRNKEDLAGSLQVEWKSSASSVVEVTNSDNGKATIVAHGAGTATLTATGGTFSQDIPVTVSP